MNITNAHTLVSFDSSSFCILCQLDHASCQCFVELLERLEETFDQELICEIDIIVHDFTDSEEISVTDVSDLTTTSYVQFDIRSLYFLESSSDARESVFLSEDEDQDVEIEFNIDLE
ncbi:Oncoid [Papillomaviridae sp. Seabass_c17043]|nr:Oncoid [Papillomaviridae sp. Seabass_c17043]